MDTEKQLEAAISTNHLVLVVFYGDGTSHYEWIDPMLRAYEKRVVELVKMSMEGNETLAESYHIRTAPAFLLLHGKHELWRQVGGLTVNDLKDMLHDFR